MTLDGKLVIVTGAGGGIGSAVCQLFAQEKATVVASDINENSLLKTFESLKGDAASFTARIARIHNGTLDTISKSFQNSTRSKGGIGSSSLSIEHSGKGKHLAVKSDVTSSSSVEALADRIIEVYGQPPSVVVHTAGLQTYYAGLLKCSEEQWDFTVSVNLKGTFLINKKFIGLMREYGMKGSVVNFSSTAAGGSIKAPDYSASKAAVEGFTKSVGKEMAPYGIRVNAVAPGPIDTQLLHGLGHWQLLQDATPVGRLGTPEEVAKLCLFLANDQCTFCTASVYPINGGFQR